MGQLRRLLADHQREQVEYIVDRFFDSLPAMLEQFPPDERPAIESMVASLAQTSPPHGLYALIDYVHFKGSGVAAGERYQGQGWGLAQVLEWMQVNGQQASLENFITAADAVLTRRVDNAPPQRDEQRWLNGWRARLQTYRPPVTP